MASVSSRSTSPARAATSTRPIGDAVAAAEIGPVDIVINSAGIVGPGRPPLETGPDEWRQVLKVNLLGTVAMMQAFVPRMIERGRARVVHFPSMAGKDGDPNPTICSASQAAVIGPTKLIGQQFAGTGVLVNAIAPGVIATPMNDNTEPAALADIMSLIPMQRLGRAEEVANSRPISPPRR